MYTGRTTPPGGPPCLPPCSHTHPRLQIPGMWPSQGAFFLSRVSLEARALTRDSEAFHSSLPWGLLLRYRSAFYLKGKTHNPILFFLILIDPALKKPNYVKPSERQHGSKHKRHRSALAKGAFFLSRLECQSVAYG